MCNHPVAVEVVELFHTQKGVGHGGIHTPCMAQAVDGQQPCRGDGSDLCAVVHGDGEHAQIFEMLACGGEENLLPFLVANLAAGDDVVVVPVEDDIHTRDLGSNLHRIRLALAVAQMRQQHHNIGSCRLGGINGVLQNLRQRGKGEMIDVIPHRVLKTLRCRSVHGVGGGDAHEGHTDAVETPYHKRGKGSGVAGVLPPFLLRHIAD